MAHDELLKVTVFSARYQDKESVKADFYKARDCYEKNNVAEDFNAAIAFKNSSNEVEILVKNEYATRQQSWIGILTGFGISIFTIVFLAILIPGYFSLSDLNEQHYVPLKVILVTILGGLLGALLGHLQSGMGRSDLKKIAKLLNKNEYGLIVISFGEMSKKIENIFPVPNQVTQHKFETTKKKLVKKVKKALLY